MKCGIVNLKMIPFSFLLPILLATIPESILEKMPKMAKESDSTQLYIRPDLHGIYRGERANLGQTQLARPRMSVEVEVR